MIYFTGPVTNANELIKIILNGIIDEVSSAWWCSVIADEASDESGISNFLMGKQKL